jgi:anaerobic selenocysteine-containing dehydrogenase
VETEPRSYCRICAAACGIVVTVDGERVVRVRGDADHPVSRGYTCSKGRGLAAWHHSASRLDRPRLRGTDVTWDDALADLAAELTTTIADHGPDAVGLYLATGLAYDAAGQVAAGTWLPSIGSRSFFTAVTVDNAPVLVAAELVTGHPMLNPVWDPASPGLLLLVGTNPVVSHGYGTAMPDPVRHLRGARERGGRIWVLDPRRTETAALADEHLAVRPGSDVAVLGALAAAVLASGADARELAEHCEPGAVEDLRVALAPFTVARAAAASGIDATVIEQLVEEVRARPGRLAIMCGTGTTMAADGVVTEWLRWVLLILTGSLDRVGGMRFNRGAINRLRPPRAARPPRAPEPGPTTRPELPRVVGQVPAVALADEIEAGALQALVITGGNPVTAFPEPDRMRAALRRLRTLVVVDVVGNELCELATHVLPATGQLERADLTLAEPTALRSGLQATRAVVAPGADRRPVWWMFASLARRMGTDTLHGTDPDLLTDDDLLRGLLARSPFDPDAVLAAGPHGFDVPAEPGWVRDTILTDRRWELAPAVMLERLHAHSEPTRAPGPGGRLVLVPRREMGWSNSVRYGGAGAEPLLRVHPADATVAGVGDGDRATVTSRHGEVVATVAVDERVERGVVSFTHGRPDHSPGALVSSAVGIDPLTAMPLASGLEVTLGPVD